MLGEESTTNGWTRKDIKNYKEWTDTLNKLDKVLES